MASLRDKMRALLVSVGCNPTPQEIGRVQHVHDSTDSDRFLLGDHAYRVNTKSESLKELEYRLFKNPLLIPAQHLQLFVTPAMSLLDQDSILYVVKALRGYDQFKARYALGKMLELDTNLSSHLEELVESLGGNIQIFYNFEEVKTQEWNGEEYVIIREI